MSSIQRVLLFVSIAAAWVLLPAFSSAQEVSQAEMELVQQAVTLMNNGDLAAAILILEPEAGKQNASPPLRGLLGAIYKTKLHRRITD